LKFRRFPEFKCLARYRCGNLGPLLINFLMNNLPVFSLFLVFWLTAGLTLSGQPRLPVLDLPEREPEVLEPVALLGEGAARENSGIVKSRHQENLFWTQNDSGDEPRIYPVKADGSVWGAARGYEPGVRIGGAINVDWEDIAVDDQGHVIVCDVGNNRNDRRDLVLYYLDEPSKLAGRTTFKRKVFFRYPEQRAYPASREQFNFDCEGVFYARGKVYLVTKNRSDTWTQLYRLDNYDPHVTNELTLVASFDIGGKTTAADATQDGRKLVITTYDDIFVFETEGHTDHWFHGKIYWMPYQAAQVEAVCFEDEETLLLACEETAELYRVELSSLQRVDGGAATPIE
jgi:hypothetical protein